MSKPLRIVLYKIHHDLPSLIYVISMLLFRRFIGLNPERGTKASQVKVISKKTGKLVHKKTATVNVHIANLIKNLLDFEWGFVQ